MKFKPNKIQTKVLRNYVGWNFFKEYNNVTD